MTLAPRFASRSSCAFWLLAAALATTGIAGCGHGGEPTGKSSSALKQGTGLPAADYDLQLDTPNPLSLEEVTFDTSDAITLGPAARVTRDGKGKSEIISMKAGPVELRPKAEADDAWSRAKLQLDPKAVLHGSAMSGNFVLGAGATVEGQQIDHPAFDPVSTVHLAVHFPAGAAQDFKDAAHGKLGIPPGRYGSIKVQPKAVLELSSGDYYAESLSVAPGGALSIDASHGPVYLSVRHKVTLDGDASISGGVGPDFVLIGVGTEAVSIAGRFEGVIVAPHAAVNVKTLPPPGQPRPGDRGAIFAKKITLAPGMVWTHEPANALIPKITPKQDLQDCADAIRVANAHADGAQVDFQALIARYCTMPGESTCSVDITARANVDYTQAALQLATEKITPAEYLAFVRDREAAVNKADDDPVFAAELCTGKDSDGDWVPDSRDKCPKTPELTATDDDGCPLTTLPPAPSAVDVHKLLGLMHISIKNDCAKGEVPPVTFAGAFYVPQRPDVGNYIFASRVKGQPPGCPVWYEFGVKDISLGLPGQGLQIKDYEVTFMDREEATDLVGQGVPVPAGAIQFQALPTDPGTRGMLGKEGGHHVIVEIRVRAMNGAGVRGPWSAWKKTTPADCEHLGFHCG